MEVPGKVIPLLSISTTFMQNEKKAASSMPRKACSLKPCVLVVFVLCLWMNHSRIQAQEIWEFTPYKVKVWLSISPTLGLSPETEQQIQRKIIEYSEIHFGPTWDTSVESTPDALFGSVLYRLDDLSVDQLLARELILMVGKSDAAKDAFLKMNPPPPPPPVDPNKPPKKLSKAEQETMADMAAKAASLTSVRTLDGAIDRIKLIAINPLQYNGLKRDISPYTDKPQWAKFRDIVKPFDGTNDDLIKELETGKTIAALVQKLDLEKFKKVARQLPTKLPWQPESLLRNNDKIFMVSVDRAGDAIRIQVKELDAYVRRMSEIVTTDVFYPEDIPRAIADLARDVFSPVVRFEETDFKTTVLRVKGAGLLTRDEHPIRVVPGDVIVPFIRRDDASGSPTVLQSIPYTFVAVTEKIDETSRFYGAIFTASKGALASAKNRRTQRVGLKLRPRYPLSMLKLGIQRNSTGVVPGTEIYLRTPGDDDLQMVGRTDWRGMLALTNTDLPVIQYDPPGESKVPAIANARQLSLDPVPPPEYRVIEPEITTTEIAPIDLSEVLKDEQGKGTNNNPDVKPEAPEASDEAAEKKAKEPPPPPPKPPEPPKQRGYIKINLPLYLYYVKNGETLLARLPIVTGLKPMDVADLPDDRRRLETEAFLKGLQGEVLDIVIRRKILESRIKRSISEKKIEKAESLLDELKRVKSYEKMSDQIDLIQRHSLQPERGPLLPGVVKRINKMLDTTRELMQKYLQDKMVRELETEINKLK